ncbi:MAG TPA: NAD(P)H-hydrate dehydratase [Gemmatimonadaceae bacterium]|nr:NAD(P)H-hydrate dehydratase [Gemmatimonadaceae bacterium]
MRVASAAESAALDAATIAVGVPSRALMQRAGAAAASVIASLYPELLEYPVAIYAGPGNNGGDAWVVARALATLGAHVCVEVVGDTRTDDARAERSLAEPMVRHGCAADARLVIDGLLGTGTRGAPRGSISEAVGHIIAARERGRAAVVSLDVPTGLDADSGAADHAVRADLTITFGTLKRGLLAGRAHAGRIVVVDIGLDASGGTEATPVLVDARWVERTLSCIPVTAHKGTRRRLVIVGGAVGMAGAPMLAARAAMRSGIGMVRLLVAPDNVPLVQQRVPAALAGAWPAHEDELRAPVLDWAHAVVLGPGLGRSAASRALVERVLRAWRGPVVLDADALNVFEGESAALGALLDGRPALITPHAVEFGRLAGAALDQVEARRFDIGRDLARRVHAAVLLKGVPTVVSGVDGECMVSATGTPALAAAGSGDLLSGIAGTLLAQLDDPVAAGACAAWAHGRAAELANDSRTIRGVTLRDIERSLSIAWPSGARVPRYPVLADLPAARWGA